MDIGKVPNHLLQEIILNKISHRRDEVILRPKIGEDCCAVDFGEHVCVLSTDPITGAVHEVGRLAVHISCNDIASCGVEPIGLLVTILAPPGTSEADLDLVMGQICETASALNVEIIGGHTEITTAVNRFVINSVAVGKASRDKLIATSGARPGDSIVMTKSAGIEGTAIIAHDMEETLVGALGSKTIERAKKFMENISVVREGVIAGRFEVSSMHDVTEGGVLGALWEVAEASGVGMTVYKSKIPIADETAAIAKYYQIDPLRLISSGCMLITCKNPDKLLHALREQGIEAAEIGIITAEKDKRLLNGHASEEITHPLPDELYKVVT